MLLLCMVGDAPEWSNTGLHLQTRCLGVPALATPNRKETLMKIFLLGISVFLLVACGGGGKGRMEQTALSGSPSSGTATQQIISSVAPQQVAVITPALTRLLQQASIQTAFGSVTQSFGDGVSPVASVSTSFNGSRFVLNLNRRDGTTTTLDSSRHDTVLATTYDPETSPVTRRSAVEGAVYTLDPDHLAVTGVAIEWSNTDFTDYIAGGYWVHVNLTDRDMPGAEIGAFIDGPAYQDRARMPMTGTASYAGIAAGTYVLRYGSDIGIPNVGPVPGSVGAGDYRGRVRMVADFGEHSVSGQIDDISIDGVIRTPQGRLYPVAREPGYTVYLDAADIGQNGRTSGAGVRLTHPLLDITETSGTWAGRFSRVDDSRGNPRAVAGTHAGRFETAAGTEAVFAGAHYGASERFD